MPAGHPASRQRQNATIPTGMALQTCDGRSPGLSPARPGHWPEQSAAPCLPDSMPEPVADPRAGLWRNVMGTYSCGGSDGLAPIFPFHPRSGGTIKCGHDAHKTPAGSRHAPIWRPYPSGMRGLVAQAAQPPNPIDPCCGLPYRAHIVFISTIMTLI